MKYRKPGVTYRKEKRKKPRTEKAQHEVDRERKLSKEFRAYLLLSGEEGEREVHSTKKTHATTERKEKAQKQKPSQTMRGKKCASRLKKAKKKNIRGGSQMFSF